MLCVGRERWNRSPRSLCSIQVQNPGSSGGLSTVTTNATLTGAGTVASPLGVNGWPIQGFSDPALFSSTFGVTANKLMLNAIQIPYEFTFSKLFFNLSAADPSNNSDFGVYNLAGTLIANSGAAHYGTSGYNTLTMLQGSQTQPPGIYFTAATSAAGNLLILGSYVMFQLLQVSNFGTSTGGALPASITPPAFSPTNFRCSISLL